MRAKRVDANQKAITEALRAAGASVLSLASLGQGVPDLLVWSPYTRQLILMECKNPNVPKADRQLTDDQVKWHHEWKGPIRVVETEQQALDWARLKL